MIHKFIQGFQEVLHILYNMFEILILLECPCRAELQSLSQIFKGYYWYNFMEYIENINACDDVFSEYCFDDENISVQPERINTPGISDLDSDIDLSGISFIQRETNQALGLKYAPVDGDGYCLLRAILVLKQHDYSWGAGQL
ncbi:yccE [Escherichia coli]|uniref:YccE n=1 Tax=Escherichia coli TaxID=562 RepID=A0A377DVN9_ECOLX|nr:yccE [Escherichia coli]